MLFDLLGGTYTISEKCRETLESFNKTRSWKFSPKTLAQLVDLYKSEETAARVCRFLETEPDGRVWSEMCGEYVYNHPEQTMMFEGILSKRLVLREKKGDPGKQGTPRLTDDACPLAICDSMSQRSTASAKETMATPPDANPTADEDATVTPTGRKEPTEAATVAPQSRNATRPQEKQQFEQPEPTVPPKDATVTPRVRKEPTEAATVAPQARKATAPQEKQQIEQPEPTVAPKEDVTPRPKVRRDAKPPTEAKDKELPVTPKEDAEPPEEDANAGPSNGMEPTVTPKEELQEKQYVRLRKCSKGPVETMPVPTGPATPLGPPEETQLEQDTANEEGDQEDAWEDRAYNEEGDQDAWDDTANNEDGDQEDVWEDTAENEDAEEPEDWTAEDAEEPEEPQTVKPKKRKKNHAEAEEPAEPQKRKKKQSVESAKSKLEGAEAEEEEKAEMRRKTTKRKKKTNSVARASARLAAHAAALLDTDGDSEDPPRARITDKEKRTLLSALKKLKFVAKGLRDGGLERLVEEVQTRLM